MSDKLQQVLGSTDSQKRGKCNQSVRLLVLGVTEKHGQAWDLICNADGIGAIIVDPFVSCAWPVGTDSDRRAMVGKEYVMTDFQVAHDGCYLPEKFSNRP